MQQDKGTRNCACEPSTDAKDRAHTETQSKSSGQVVVKSKDLSCYTPPQGVPVR